MENDVTKNAIELIRWQAENHPTQDGAWAKAVEILLLAYDAATEDVQLLQSQLQDLAWVSVTQELPKDKDVVYEVYNGHITLANHARRDEPSIWRQCGPGGSDTVKGVTHWRVYSPPLSY